MIHESLGRADAMEAGKENLELITHHKDILPEPLTVACCLC